ncbi:hypothetical protein BIV59_21650 [Bacillus sp. MUM 13]|nr:hypothetical protein BIV59_21650 [Bacillus sp. MUM 13]
MSKTVLLLIIYFSLSLLMHKNTAYECKVFFTYTNVAQEWEQGQKPENAELEYNPELAYSFSFFIEISLAKEGLNGEH